MTTPLVLDSDGLAALSTSHPPEALRAYLEEAHRLGRDVIVPAVVCAEVCRGIERTRRVEAAIARTARRGRAPVTITLTDFDMARQVGAILHASGAGTQDMVDAHVVAACVPHGGGLVVTADPNDIDRLAASVPSIRIVTRSAH